MDNRIKTTDDVIEASHVVIRDGLFPVRIVLRKLDKEYVTHKEMLRTLPPNKELSLCCAMEHHAFENGNYFPWNLSVADQDLVFQKAMDDFNARAAKL